MRKERLPAVARGRRDVAILDDLERIAGIDRVICPPAISIAAAHALTSASGVALGEAPEGRPLVGRVVVDVQVGIRAAALGDEVDELRERVAFALAVVGPEGAVGRAPVGLAPQDAEQELEPLRGIEERVALHVEEDVARRWCR